MPSFAHPLAFDASSARGHGALGALTALAILLTALLERSAGARRDPESRAHTRGREKLGLPASGRRSRRDREEPVRHGRHRLFARWHGRRGADARRSREAQAQAGRRPPHRAVLSVDRGGGEIPLLLEVVLGLAVRLVRARLAGSPEHRMARQLRGALLGAGLAGHHLRRRQQLSRPHHQGGVRRRLARQGRRVRILREEVGCARADDRLCQQARGARPGAQGGLPDRAAERRGAC